MLRRLRALDSFRPVEQEFSNASSSGGLVTMVAALLGVILSAIEINEMFTITTRSEVVMAPSDDMGSLRINFNVTFFDLECQYVGIGVRDSFGTERYNMQHKVSLKRLDHTGASGAYTQEEVFALDKDGVSNDGENAETDADWVSDTDGVDHAEFSDMVQAHDYTVVFFYMRATKHNRRASCAPCKAFRPIWDTFEEETNNQHSGLRAMRINCADFETKCTDQDIRAVPQVRFYRRGEDAVKNYKIMQVRRGQNATRQMLDTFVADSKKALGGGAKHVAHHNVFKEACQVSGTLDVARVPGTLHFEAVHGAEHGEHLNFALTNISHEVHHLSFNKASDFYKGKLKRKAGLPEEYQGSEAPLDGQTFISHAFHHAPHHYMKVVATHLEVQEKGWFYSLMTRPIPMTTYQMTVQSRVAHVPLRQAPSARFSYDLAPVEVRVVQERGRELFDLITTLFAVIGGTYSVFAILAPFIKVLEAKMQK